MNVECLNAMSEIANKYNVDLQDGEKVVFTAIIMFGTEKDRLLGSNSAFTLTNKRIIADNNVGVWTVDITDDIVGCTRIQKGRIFKTDYFSVSLNKEIVFDNGKQTLTGFHFYFDKPASAKFEEIMNNLFS